MKYGKIKCGTLRVPMNYPGYIVVDGVKVYNPTDEQLIAAGYLPIVETDKPEEREGYCLVAKYAQDGDKIVQSWEYVEVTNEETTDDDNK